jgi:hypothetical protein
VRRILRTKGRPDGQSVVRGRATLYSDRLELTGWTLRGRYRRNVALTDIERIEWWTAFAGTPNVLLRLADGSEQLFWLENGGLWRFELAALLGERVTQGSLPGGVRSVRTAA